MPADNGDRLATLTQLGGNSDLPESPEAAILEKVANGQAGTD